MGPRRRPDHDGRAEAARQTKAANSTFNQFLGGNQAPAWLNGGCTLGTPDVNNTGAPTAPSRTSPNATSPKSASPKPTPPHATSQTPSPQELLESTHNGGEAAASTNQSPVTRHDESPAGQQPQSPPPVAAKSTNKLSALQTYSSPLGKRKRMEGHQNGRGHHAMGTGKGMDISRNGRSTHQTFPVDPSTPAPGQPQSASPVNAMAPPRQPWQPRAESMQGPPRHARMPSHGRGQNIAPAPIYPVHPSSGFSSPMSTSPVTPNLRQSAGGFPSPQDTMNGTLNPPGQPPLRPCQPSQHSRRASRQPGPVLPSNGPPLPASLPKTLPYTREHCEGPIKHFQATAGSLNLNREESTRLHTLLMAAQADDSIFLFIHFIVAQFVNAPNTIPRMLRQAPGFSDSMNVIHSVLAGAQVKNVNLMIFFAQVPCSLAHLALEWPDSYQLLIHHVVLICSSLRQNYNGLIEACRSRGYPPLATEFWRMSIMSPTL